MSDKNFGTLKTEWLEGYTEAKAEGDAAQYIIMTIVITMGMAITLGLFLGLILWIFKAVFWYVCAAFIYTGVASMFGWPTPLSLIKKALGK